MFENKKYGILGGKMLQVVFDNHEKNALKIALTISNKTDWVWTEREDIVGMVALLNAGEINYGLISEERKQIVFKMLQNGFTNAKELKRIFKTHWQTYREGYREIKKRAGEGEQIRIWYSNASYSLCGFYALVYELEDVNCPVTVVKLPEWTKVGDRLKLVSEWGEIDPEEWAGFEAAERELSVTERRLLAEKWRVLKRENTFLRASVNGQLQSVASDFYDGFICESLSDQELKVSQLIANVIGRNRLGVSDWLLASRIRRMLQTGVLVQTFEGADFYNTGVKMGGVANQRCINEEVE